MGLQTAKEQSISAVILTIKNYHIFGREYGLKMTKKHKTELPFNRFNKVNRDFRLYGNFEFFPQKFEKYIKDVNPIKESVFLIGLIGFYDFVLMVFSSNLNYYGVNRKW